MSPIARVFIVINVVLAVAFIVFCADYLSNASSYKADMEKMEKQKDEEIAGLMEKNDKLKGELDLVKTDYQKAKNDVNKLENDKKSLQERNQELKTKGARNSQELAEARSDISTIKNTLESIMRESSQLREKEKAAVAAREEAENAKLSLEQQVAVLEREKEKLNEKIGESLANIGEMEDKINGQRILIERYIAKIGPLEVSQPSIEAKVMDVTPAMNLVTLSVGKDDGVKRGFTFDVFRGSQYKGRVTVQEVDSKLCVAKYKKNLIKRDIQKGDSARTNM